MLSLIHRRKPRLYTYYHTIYTYFLQPNLHLCTKQPPPPPKEVEEFNNKSGHRMLQVFI